MRHVVRVQYRDRMAKDCEDWRFNYSTGDAWHEYTTDDILGMVWEQWNAGSGHESEQFLNLKVRSMMVGDYVCVGAVWYEVLSVGWARVMWSKVFESIPQDPNEPPDETITVNVSLLDIVGGNSKWN